MEYIETAGAEKTRGKPSQEILSVPPKDFRAAHCKTVEEYRLWRFSSNYQTSNGGENDIYHEAGIEDLAGDESV